LGDDSKNIAAAVHIRQLFQHKDIESELRKANLAGTREENEKVLENLKKKFDDPESGRSPLIFAVVNDARRADNLVETSKGKEADQARCNYHIHPIATLLNAYHIDNLYKLRNLEKSALKNHLSWAFKSVLASDATQVDQNTMDALVENAEKYVKYSYYRDSSVATSLHQELLRKVDGELKNLVNEEAPTVTEIKKIIEKMRWNAYMRALGYQYLEVRNDRIKFHHLLVPYHDLSEDEKKKDLIEF
jgi:transcription elongation GreA/GreB family factor